MKIIIFGAASIIGRELLWQARELGHAVTAFSGPDTIPGHDVVFCVQEEGICKIIGAMKMAGIKRLICLSAMDADPYIETSGLDWTIVRHGELIAGQLTGCYKHGFERPVQPAISPPDVALFMLMQITSTAYLQKSPFISY